MRERLFYLFHGWPGHFGLTEAEILNDRFCCTILGRRDRSKRLRRLADSGLVVGGYRLIRNGTFYDWIRP